MVYKAFACLQENFPETMVLMQTVFEEDDKIFQSIQAGAHGYVLKKTPPEELIAAIYDVMQGGSPMSAIIARKVLQLFKSNTQENKMQTFDLSAREVEILSCLVDGFKPKNDCCTIKYFCVHRKQSFEKSVSEIACT